MQAVRFEDVFSEFQQALSHAQERARCNNTEGNSMSWKEHYDRTYRPYAPQRPVKVPTLALSMQVATDLDFLIVAARNVLRAQDRLPVQLKTSMTDEGILTLLRNVAEHWDEDGESIEKLASDHPDVSPGDVIATNKEIWIGGTVPLSRVRAWLARIHLAFVTALESEGVTVPEDMASVVEGDDALSWPSDRRRYRYWSLPVVDEEDWPTRTMPPEVASLLTERFRRLRQRDGAD